MTSVPSSIISRMPGIPMRRRSGAWQSPSVTRPMIVSASVNSKGLIRTEALAALLVIAPAPAALARLTASPTGAPGATSTT